MTMADKDTDRFVWKPGDIQWQDAKPPAKTSAQKLADKIKAK